MFGSAMAPEDTRNKGRCYNDDESWRHLDRHGGIDDATVSSAAGAMGTTGDAGLSPSWSPGQSPLEHVCDDVRPSHVSRQRRHQD
jgi:hypothetical protein